MANAIIEGNQGEDAAPVNEEAQEEFVTGFQAVLKRISDVFDKIFNAIFEFLRLDEVLGRN